MKGKLIIISGPSGAGKTTIARYLLKHNSNLEFSISACTRLKRPEEVEGKDYYFLNKVVFDQKINNNEFLEWEEVYGGLYYGTLITEVERIWNNNHHVIFDIDVKGAINIKNAYPGKTLAVLIKPPSLIALFKRLKKRSTEDNESLSERTRKAEEELMHENEFDEAVINDNLEVALQQTNQLVRSFLEKS